MYKKNIFIILFLSITFLLSVACSSQKDNHSTSSQKKLLLNNNYDADTAMFVSVSSDGEYAVTSSVGKSVILWDIQHKTKTLISTNANIYSAYFIKNSDKFIWQDLNDIVHVEDVYGNMIETFKASPTYSEVMTSNLNTYFSTDEDWNLWKRENNQLKIIKKEYGGAGFIGAEKPMNLTLSLNDQFLLTSGNAEDGWDNLPIKYGFSTLGENAKPGYGRNLPLMDGIVLWNVQTGKPLRKFAGNENKTIATLSPDGKYVVGCDEAINCYVWLTNIGKRLFQLESVWDQKGNRAPPKTYSNVENGFSGVISVKFIDANHYLRFSDGVPYADLFNIQKPYPLKYFYLGIKPAPSVASYDRDESIDTAPAVHILVTGQDTGSGINVYQYDPKTQTLQLIWTPNGLFKNGKTFEQDLGIPQKQSPKDYEKVLIKNGWDPDNPNQ